MLSKRVVPRPGLGAADRPSRVGRSSGQMSLDELAAKLARSRSASRLHHRHLTRRIVSLSDMEEYRKLPHDKRHVLLQAARFAARFNASSAFPMFSVVAALFVTITLKQADVLGVAIDAQMVIVGIVIGFLAVLGLSELYDPNKRAAHAQTWVDAFEDAERNLKESRRANARWPKTSSRAKNPRDRHRRALP